MDDTTRKQLRQGLVNYYYQQYLDTDEENRKKLFKTLLEDDTNAMSDPELRAAFEDMVSQIEIAAGWDPNP